MERNANIIFNEETIDGTTTKTDLTEMCQDVIKEYQQEVENLKMKKEQNLFIACAWMTNKERGLFRLFPRVVKVDVVKGANQKEQSRGHKQWTQSAFLMVSSNWVNPTKKCRVLGARWGLYEYSELNQILISSFTK
eukprot:scaffold2174_cov92-Amphora_coffeaeformis.AAC.1